MNKNLKLLDLVDKKENIYKVIAVLSKRAHDLLAGVPPRVETKIDEPTLIAIEEYIAEREKNE